MRLKLFELVSRLNASYWFVPLVVTLAGALLCVGLLALDARVSFDPYSFWARLRPGSTDGARALLSSVVGAMITAISVTFSVTIVALTVAAQHFGPRVLGSFVRQTSAQLVLGTFMATFIYSVLALGGIRSGDTDDIPELTVSGAVLLVIVSIGALIYYVHHVSTTLQIGYIAESIAADFRHTLNWADRSGARACADESEMRQEPPGTAVAVAAHDSGYLQRVDHGALVELAAARNARIWIRRAPGAFFVQGAPLAFVESAGAVDEAFRSELLDTCAIGRDRSLWQDAEFALKQLVEIALRALSPGVNEPFTALTAIDRLAECLAGAAAADRPPATWCDESGRARLHVPVPSFATLVHAAYDPIRINAGNNPAVHVRLIDVCAELALLVRNDADRRLLIDGMETIRRDAERHIEDPVDREYVEMRYREAGRLLS